MDDLYEQWLDQLGIRDIYGDIDEREADLLYRGWFADDDELGDDASFRADIRQEFYDLSDLDKYDIDWEAWKEYMYG